MEYEKLHIDIANKKGTYHRLNDSGIDAHFYPANGFPIGTYHSFLKTISPKYKLHSLAMRACWDNIGAPKTQTKFNIYAEDLAVFIKQKFEKPIIGIGHSQGATCTLMAAAKNPNMFSELILVEPASLSKDFAFAMALTPYYFKKTKEPFKSTLRKPNYWNSKEDYFNFCRKLKAFKRINDNNLKEIVENSLIKDKDRFRLVFPSNWEVSNYALPPSITKLFNKISIPVRIIAGKPNLFCSQKLRTKWLSNFKNVSIQVLEEFGHLVPFEAPQICGNIIIKQI